MWIDDDEIQEIRDRLDRLTEAGGALLKDGLPAKCYAYVPDPADPSTWKLPYLNADGSVDETHLSGAAAAFSPGGFRGKKVQIPAGDVAAVKKKLLAAYHKWGKKDEEIPKQLLESGGGGTELLETVRQEGDKWVLYTEDGSKKLGEFNSEEEAKKREEQIKWFKSKESEGEREHLERFIPLLESERIDSDGMIKLRIIKAGFGNKKDNHYYPASTLERDYRVFEGKKMFCDHQTLREKRERPERSLKDWVATIKEVWHEKGEVWARAKVHNPWFREFVREAGEYMGVSIDADGLVVPGVRGGRQCRVVEAIPYCECVDFVTKAGAGGLIAPLYESARKEEEMFENMTDEEVLAKLTEAKPGVLDKLRESTKEDLRKEVEDELSKKVLESAAPLKKTGEGAEETHTEEPKNAQLTEAERRLSCFETREAVTIALEKSPLPEISKDRIRESFREQAFDDDEKRVTAIKEALKKEAEYVSKLTEAGKIKGLGEGEEIDDLKEAQKDMDKMFGVEDKEEK